MGQADAEVAFPVRQYLQLEDIDWSEVEQPGGPTPLIDLGNMDPAALPRAEASPQAGKLAGDTLKAMIDITEWAHTHRSEAAAIAAREMGVSVPHAERGWDYYMGKNVLTRDIEVNMKGFSALIDVQRSAGLLPAGAPADPEFYIDRSYLAAARQARAGGQA